MLSDGPGPSGQETWSPCNLISSEEKGSLPCPGPPGTSGFSQTVCVSHRTEVCPGGTWARSRRAQCPGDLGLEPGREEARVSGWRPAGTGAGRGGSLRQEGRLRRLGSCWSVGGRSRSQVPVRLLLALGGYRKGVASVPALRSPAHCGCVCGHHMPGRLSGQRGPTHRGPPAPGSPAPFHSVGLPATPLAGDRLALVSTSVGTWPSPLLAPPGPL